MILGVNIDHLATIRQARGGIEPDPVMAVPMVIMGGADGITVHLREDRRHISDRDLGLLKEIVPVELNLEMAATKEMLSIAARTRPDLATLVPEKRQELTTEGGLDVARQRKKIRESVKRLHDAAVPVSLFINPNADDVEAAMETGADMVELHTGAYADSKGKKKEVELKRIYKAAGHAMDMGLTVNAGHGLNYFNVRPVAGIKGLRGLYIGHSIISRAVFVGIERAVREMKQLIGICL